MPQAEYLQYGGQAVIEGVMMRTPRFFSVACRAPNQEIVVQTERIEKTWIGRQKWLQRPFLRGTWAILDGVTLGARAMRFASHVQLDEKLQVDAEASKADAPPNKSMQNLAVGGAIVGGLAFGFLIFNAIPNAIAQTTGVNDYLKNLITELVKIVFMFAYIGLIAQLKEIKEVFKYHGAEHKAINTLEAGEPLDMEHCRAQTRLHPRCGTSFIVVVLAVSLVIGTAFPRNPFGLDSNVLIVLARLGVELFLLTPIIAGISYEFIRVAGRYRDERWVNLLFAPGLKTQLITTAEPNDGQIEVALAALQAVVDAEKSEEESSDQLAAQNQPHQTTT
jgi:uncharacterized protein YqhQ